MQRSISHFPRGFARIAVLQLVIVVFIGTQICWADEFTLNRFLVEAPKAWAKARAFYDGKSFKYKNIRKNGDFVVEGVFEQTDSCWRMARTGVGSDQEGKSWSICNQFYTAYLSEGGSSNYVLNEIESKNVSSPEKENASIPIWKTNNKCLGLCYPSFEYGGGNHLFNGFRNMSSAQEDAIYEVHDAISGTGMDGCEVVTLKISVGKLKIQLKLLPERLWCVLESEIVGVDRLVTTLGEMEMKTIQTVSFEYEGQSCHPSRRIDSLQVGNNKRVTELFIEELQSSSITCRDCRLPAFGLPEPPEYVSEERIWKWWHVLVLITTAVLFAVLGNRFLRKGPERKRTARSGFTLVELLVVIGVIGVLTAILLPAIQRVREAGRRTVCSNNVRQLALSVMNFESSHGQLPIGLRSFDDIDRNLPGRDYFGVSWITLILPFAENNSMWQQAKEDYRRFSIPFRSHRGMQTVLPLVACPSDPSSSEVHFTHEGYLVACTDYLGVNGTNFQARDGVFTYDEPARLSAIADGQSNTLMIGERPPSRDFWYGWWYATGSGSMSTGDVTLGIAELNPAMSTGFASYLEDCPPGPYRYEAGQNEQCDTLHFWSYHSGGANFGLADGSVRLLPFAIDQAVAEALATRAGGEAVSPEF